MSWKIDGLKIEALPNFHSKVLKNILLAVLFPHYLLEIFGYIISLWSFLSSSQLDLLSIEAVTPIELIISVTILFCFSVALYEYSLRPNCEGGAGRILPSTREILQSLLIVKFQIFLNFFGYFYCRVRDFSIIQHVVTVKLKEKVLKSCLHNILKCYCCFKMISFL